MANRIIRIGAQHQIATQSFLGDAVVTEAHGIQTADQKGVLVNYRIEDYGETNAFVKRFDMFRKHGSGLYIYSDTKGSGKTMLACCIVNEVLKEFDIPVKFISMPEYIELVYQFL